MVQSSEVPEWHSAECRVPPRHFAPVARKVSLQDFLPVLVVLRPKIMIWYFWPGCDQKPCSLLSTVALLFLYLDTFDQWCDQCGSTVVPLTVLTIQIVKDRTLMKFCQKFVMNSVPKSFRVYLDLLRCRLHPVKIRFYNTGVGECKFANKLLLYVSIKAINNFVWYR